jgi:hypothetical protein
LTRASRAGKLECSMLRKRNAGKSIFFAFVARISTR